MLAHNNHGYNENMIKTQISFQKSLCQNLLKFDIESETDYKNYFKLTLKEVKEKIARIFFNTCIPISNKLKQSLFSRHQKTYS